MGIAEQEAAPVAVPGTGRNRAAGFFSHGTQDIYPTFLQVQHGLSPGVVGAIAVTYNIGAIMGGIFVAEALSVMLQVSYFKYTKRKYGEGRRILKMAPLHHHFEKSGWKETQVVVRFWIITMLLCLLGLSTLKLR